MMLDFEIPPIRVYQANTYKGHSVAVAEILGIPVLFADGTLEENEADMWEGIFKMRLARVLAKLMLAEGGENELWGEATKTGREVYTDDTVRLEREKF
jgi:hypothetical protein